MTELHANHDHEHGPDCEHTGVQHGDHVDYLHDGHLHHVRQDGTVEEQTAVLQAMEQARQAGPMPLPPFFHTMKELTLVGYYTSEIGATQELQWLAAPGRYDGCASLEEIGRTWA